MRALQLLSEFAYPATATTSNANAVVFTAANVGSVFGGQESVPGEDMGFPSSGSGVVAVELEGVTAAAGDTITIQVSNNYYLDSGSGETFTTVKTVTLPALTTKSKTIFVDRVPWGEAVRVSITTTGATGAGTVSAYALSE
jgi:hypothetical protein